MSWRLKISGELEINAVGDEKIKQLNKTYGGIGKVTDVLSFAWREDKVVKSGNNFLGQIYICYPQITRQAKKFKVPAKEEFARILIHGILHLLGYDHQEKKDAEKMFKLQEGLVKSSFKN